MKMKMRFKLLSIVLACLMMILSGTGCAHSKPTQEPEPTDTIEVSNQNSDTTDMSDEEKESMMQDIWTDIRAKALSEAGIKVLFIGDSLTYYNDMPLIFEAFSKAAGKNVRVDSFTKGGTGIAMMRDDATLWTKISDKIASENWDIVVLQPQRNQTVMTEFFPHYPWKEYSAAKDLVTLIQDAGAVPLLYSTFGVTKGSVTRDGFTKTMTRTEHTDLITAYNATVSDLLGCKTVYAGVTFQTAYEKKPSINLYHTDRSHPCLAGSYLIAADFYTVIFGEPAKEVNYLGGLETEMATFLCEQSTLLLQFVPTQKAEVKEYSSSEKFSLGFGAHGFSNVAAAGSTNVLTVLSEDHVQYVYQSGHDILSSFVKLNGTDVIGNQLSAQMKLRFGTYCGSLHPSGGFILATEDGKMIRMYARTNSSNITGTDCSGAKFEVRVDIDKKNSVVLGSYDRELTMTVTVTPSALTLYVNDVVFVTMTSSGAVFYEGTTSSNLKYNGQKVHLGLVFCYADVDFSNVTITTK